MLEFRLESWMAVAPGLSTPEEWLKWSLNPHCLIDEKVSADLSSIPAMLRRRFSLLGKTALSSALPLLNPDEKITSVFASRHGDTALTLSLLESMAHSEALSPTKFSLAVHNAVSGLFTIARNDTSAVTSIAATQGLFIQALIEAAGLLVTQQRVLCVIHDVPLALAFSDYTNSNDFPYAIAIILNKSEGRKITLQALDQAPGEISSEQQNKLISNELEFISLLAGAKDSMQSLVHGSTWRTSVAKADDC